LAISRIHSQILQLQREVNLMYDIAENSTSRSQLSHNATLSLDNSINRYNDLIMNLICYLRKLESFYMLYFPNYVRKPKYQNEEL
jgi:hypothetical protein